MRAIGLGLLLLLPALLLAALPPARAEDPTEEEREAGLAKADVLNARVYELFRAGKYREAEPLARQSLAIREAILGSDHPGVALGVVNLGAQLEGQGRFREAQPLFERAVRIYEKALGPEDPLVAECLTNLAALHMAVGQYQVAESHLERALAIHEKAFEPDHAEVAEALNNLAELLRRRGRYRQALPLLVRSLRIYDGVADADASSVATTLNNMGELLRDMGLYERARPLYEAALEIYESVLGSDHLLVGVTLDNLATLHRLTGEYEKAQPLQERAIRILRSALGPTHPDVALSLNNLAELLRITGRYEQALPLYERAIEIFVRSFGDEHPALATLLCNLAVVLHLMGRTEQAVTVQKRALRGGESAHGARHPSVARIHNDLAHMLSAQGKSEQALDHLEQALESLEETLGPDHPTLAAVLDNLASVMRARGELQEARPLQQRALQIYEGALGPESSSVARCLHALALLSMKGGELEEAVPLLERCLTIFERRLQQNFVGLQPAERVPLVRSHRVYLDTWLTLAPLANRPAYPAVLRFKGLVARANAAERRLVRHADEQWIRQIQEFRAAERRYAMLAHSMPPLFDKERYEAWQDRYAEAGAEREELALALARDCAPLREGLQRQDLGLAAIRAHLEPDAVLVDYLRTSGRYRAWVVKPDGSVHWLNLGEAPDIEEAAAEFVRLTTHPADGSDDELRHRAGSALRDLVWTPIRSQLAPDVRTVYLCPDAVLAAVPFAALPGDEEDGFVLDDFVLRLVSMAQDLVPWDRASAPTARALVVGDVDYATASDDVAPAPDPLHAAIAHTDRAPRGRTFLPLPQTRGEAGFIQSRLGERCTTLLGADATEARVRVHASDARILHLATHGFLFEDVKRGLRRGREREETWLGVDRERQLAAGHDPMNLAGLALAGANARDGGGRDDGILTALEASYLDLDGVDLVVLSACDTARGRAEAGEGVLGLVQGFQMAGAERVVASLWRVDDEATRLLMEHFYDGVLREEDPLSPAEALREAALKVRVSKGSRGQSFAAPTYWASFVCYGP